MNASSEGAAEGQHYWLTLAVLVLAALSFALLQTMVIPALPVIQEDLGTSIEGSTWVVTIYLLSASVATPLAGRLGDMFGKRRLLLITLGVLAMGALVAAVAESLGLLIAARAMQGIGGAVFPLGYGIVRDEFHPSRVAFAVGVLSATWGIGGGLGPLVAGVVVDHLAYQWIFWISIPLVGFAAVSTYLVVPESPLRRRARIDWLGAVLLALAAVALLVGISQGNAWGWASGRIIGILGVGVVLMIVLATLEKRRLEPFLDIRLLQRRAIWATNLSSACVGFALFATLILVPQFVQASSPSYGFSASVMAVALFLLPFHVMQIFAAPFAGWIASRVGARLPFVIGIGLGIAAFLMLTLAHSERWQIYVAMAVSGTFIGLSVAAMVNLIVEAVPPEQTSAATGVNTLVRQLGGALGSQASASIVAASADGVGGVPSEAGFQVAFLVTAGVLVAGIVVAAFGGLRGDRAERSLGHV